MEIYAGEKSTKVYGPDVWLPEETLAILEDYVVSIKGPLTTPVGGGIRSLNVALRQELDLYVCLRPVRYFTGRAQSPVKRAREDRHGDLPRELGGHLRRHRMGGGIEPGEEGHRLPDQGDGRQEDPLSRRPPGSASSRCRAKAPSAWCARRSSTRSTTTRKSVTLVHKGNIMKFTEGGFRDWGYALAQKRVRRAADRRRPVVQVQEPEDRHARSSSRT